MIQWKTSWIGLSLNLLIICWIVIASALLISGTCTTKLMNILSTLDFKCSNALSYNQKPNFRWYCQLYGKQDSTRMTCLIPKLSLCQLYSSQYDALFSVRPDYMKSTSEVVISAVYSWLVCLDCWGCWKGVWEVWAGCSWCCVCASGEEEEKEGSKQGGWVGGRRRYRRNLPLRRVGLFPEILVAG